MIVTVISSLLILIMGRERREGRHYEHGHLGSFTRKLQLRPPQKTNCSFPAGHRGKGEMGAYTVRLGDIQEVFACQSNLGKYLLS